MTDINVWMVIALVAVPAAGLAGAAVSAALITRKQKKREQKKERKHTQMKFAQEQKHMQMHFAAEHFPPLSGGQFSGRRLPEAGAYEETGVLGTGRGETSVFGAGFSPPPAILIRRQTGTRADIRGPLFLIGKDRQRADLHMEGNDAVSRIHAGIVCKDGRYYLIDRNSTNGTWLNGRRLEAGEEALLEPGDRIRLADEELDFWL